MPPHIFVRWMLVDSANYEPVFPNYSQCKSHDIYIISQCFMLKYPTNRQSSTIINHHQPSSTIINHHQPSSTIINHHQPLNIIEPSLTSIDHQYPCKFPYFLVLNSLKSPISCHSHPPSPPFRDAADGHTGLAADHHQRPVVGRQGPHQDVGFADHLRWSDRLQL